MSDTEKTFVSEEESVGYASPTMDLIAAATLIALSVWIMIMSVRLPVPSDIATAPGLLPFLTAASVCAMALVLGYIALQRRKIDMRTLADDIPPELGSTLLLMVVLLIYISALQVLAFETAVQFAGIRYVFGSFELVSIVVLTAIFRIYWTSVLWACLAVSCVWIIFLSMMFRLVFKIPLPV
ncbi:MAG: hypothetical protein ACR2OW_05330 [Methyloligellaceae bacterium]